VRAKSKISAHWICKQHQPKDDPKDQGSKHVKSRTCFLSSYRLGLCLFLVVLPVRLFAQEMQTEIVYSHRADEIAPLLASLAAPEGTVTAYKDQLIIRAPAEKMPVLLDSLKQIDRPLKNLRISVRPQQTISAYGATVGAQGHLKIQGRQIAGGVDIHAQAQEAQKIRQDYYSVTTTEGASVQIATGSVQPSLTVINSNTQMTAFGQAYVPAQSGMMVTPRLQPDGRVMLDIRFQQQASERKGSIQSASVQSQIQTRLGEWTPLSTIEQSIRVAGSDMARQSQRRSQSSMAIEILVEELP
jgi:hypothetical protein